MVRDVVADYIPLSTVFDWWEQTVLLVTDFESFIERKVNRRGVRYEVLLVLFIGALGSAGMYYLSQQVMEASRLDEMAFVAIGRTIRPVGTLILLWVLYTVFFYFVTNHFGGYGHARRLVKGIAWAFMPFALANIVRSAALWWTYQDFPFQDEFQGVGPGDHYESILQAGLMEPAMLVATAVLVLCIVWSGYLMMQALQQARSVSRQTALRIVAVPYAIHIILVVYNVYQETLTGAYLF